MKNCGQLGLEKHGDFDGLGLGRRNVGVAGYILDYVDGKRQSCYQERGPFRVKKTATAKSQTLFTKLRSGRILLEFGTAPLGQASFLDETSC